MEKKRNHGEQQQPESLLCDGEQPTLSTVDPTSLYHSSTSEPMPATPAGTHTHIQRERENGSPPWAEPSRSQRRECLPLSTTDRASPTLVLTPDCVLAVRGSGWHRGPASQTIHLYPPSPPSPRAHEEKTVGSSCISPSRPSIGRLVIRVLFPPYGCKDVAVSGWSSVERAYDDCVCVW